MVKLEELVDLSKEFEERGGTAAADARPSLRGDPGIKAIEGW